MDFQQTIAEVTQELTDSGFVRETIKKQLQKTIEDTVQNLMRSYGPVGKALEAQMQDELVLNLKRLSVTGYGEVLLPLIREQIDHTVVEAAGGPIKKMLEQYLGKLDKKTWKLSEIADQFREARAEYNTDENEFFFEAEDGYGKDSVFIGLDEKPKVSSGIYGSTKAMTRYEAKYQLYIHAGELVQFTVGGKNVTVHNATDFAGFDAFLFNLYANRCTIELDEPDTNWRPDEY